MKNAPNHIGVLWSRISESNEEYFVGRLNVLGTTQEIIIFKDKNRQSEKYPEYNMFINLKNKNRTQEADGNR